MIFDKTWTLFLDRDGVLNEDKPGGYVTGLHEFRLMEGVKEAMRQLSDVFGTIVVCTNQRGVSKGLYSLDTMHAMNNLLVKEIETDGGRIDKIYFAIDLDENAPNRKPNPGMALQAKHDFPGIDFSKSVMVGNSISDMEFARNAGIGRSVFLTTVSEVKLPHVFIDEQYPDLISFAESLTR